MPVPKRFTAKTTSLASPIGGWNARDSLAEMQPLDAVNLVNFFPTPTDVTLRKGYSKKSIGIVGNVETLMNYANKDGTDTLFAVANGVIYDASTPTATVVFEGLENSQFQHCMISTAGGQFIIAVNGEDPAIVYDGTQWFTMSDTATAVTVSTIINVGDEAIVTTATPHGLSIGNRVTISGATGVDADLYNGVFVITVSSPTTFRYTMTGTPTGSATGTIIYTVIGIEGISSSQFANINMCQDRLFFVEKDSLSYWYLNVESIAGTASEFPLGAIARSGGYLQAMGTWTLDAGYGVDDLSAFVTSMGEVIVYKGTNPSDASAWSLVGVWQLGQIFSRRCFFKFGGDLLLLTQGGLVPMSAALQSSRLDPRVNLTDKIFYAISQAATSFYNFFGWQINFFASENMLILNIPNGTNFDQYVMHTITKSWAKFTNINAFCWEASSGNKMYFGSSGFVGDFYDVTSDAGANIVATAQQAYSYFDTRGQQKRFTLVRPILQTDNGLPTVLCGISTDFDTVPLTNQIAFNPNITRTGLWDQSTWDNANWGGGLAITKFWQGVHGLGYAGSININVASQGIEFHWASTDYVMELGGVL
jgi:uncharacterized protein YigE (DUF2233 family)